MPSSWFFLFYLHKSLKYWFQARIVKFWTNWDLFSIIKQFWASVCGPPSAHRVPPLSTVCPSSVFRLSVVYLSSSFRLPFVCPTFALRFVLFLDLSLFGPTLKPCSVIKAFYWRKVGHFWVLFWSWFLIISPETFRIRYWSKFGGAKPSLTFQKLGYFFIFK
jgi:hypothetical protein